jgi:hypothetical protein
VIGIIHSYALFPLLVIKSVVPDNLVFTPPTRLEVELATVAEKSATLALSTLTPYVALPFQPIKLGYEADQGISAFVLFLLDPFGAVLLEASKIV